MKPLIVYPCQNSTDCSNILKMEKGKLRNSTKIELKKLVSWEARGLIALHSNYISVIILVSLSVEKGK